MTMLDPVRVPTRLPGAVGVPPGYVPPTFRATLRRRSAPSTVVAEITDGFGFQWQDQLNEVGAGSFTLVNDDPVLGMIQAGDLVLFEVDDAPAFTMLVRELTRTTIAEGEESAQTTTVSGPSTLAVLDEAVVYPVRPLWCWPIQDDRLFSWPSFDYYDAWWGRPEIMAPYKPWDYPYSYWGEDLGEGNFQPWPKDFPDELGSWQWGAGAGTWQYAKAGTVYMRMTFGVYDPDITKVEMFVAADNVGHIYFDGQRVGETEWARGETNVWSQKIDVTPGLHVVAFEVVNAYSAVTEQLQDLNPGGLLMTIYNLGPDERRLEPPIARSDAFVSWTVLPYPTTVPGMTPGEAMLICIREARDNRGGLAGVSTTFTDRVDSAGKPWPVMGEISTRVGNDLLTFFKELTNTYVDFAMSPGGLVLSAWAKGTRGQDRNVALTPPTDPQDPWSGNLRQLTHRRIT